MEFDISRCYSAINADELRVGDKVIVADCLATLRDKVINRTEWGRIDHIAEDCNGARFVVDDNMYLLAYLVERAKNCTNCGAEPCGYRANHDVEDNKINKCPLWFKPKTEKHYRPFRDVNELIKVWEEKTGATPYWGKGADLFMPHIWVKRKNFPKDKGTLITSFDEDIVYVGICQRTMNELSDEYTFLDDSPCRIEE